MRTRAFVAMLLALLVPGAGHLYLGRRSRGAAFFAIVVLMFAVGLAVEGGLYTPVSASGPSMLRSLASYGSMGSGLLYAAAWMAGVSGRVASATFEYGTTFTLTAGLMNLLLVLDCWDIAHDRKE